MASSKSKVSDKELNEIKDLFKDGLTKARNSPKKYWDQKRVRDDKTPPWKGFTRKK